MNPMSTYEKVREEFTWQEAWDAFEGDRDEFNLAHEIFVNHAEDTGTAVRIVDFENGGVEEVTYSELADRAAQFANYLDEVGLSKGDRVAAMMQPRPELYATILGTWLGGYVYVPLFTLFGPEALEYRLTDSDTKVLATAPGHQDKVDVDAIESLEQIVVAGGTGTNSFEEVRSRSTGRESVRTAGTDLSTIQYTSGTTGPPKGVKIQHAQPISTYPYRKYAADIRRDDNYFGAAPPAWSYGLFMCTFQPLFLGIGTTTYRGQFDPEPFVDVLDDYDITNLFAPPTAFRMLASLELDLSSRDFSLRHAYCAGGPLDSGTVDWGREVFGVSLGDHYGFTEGGMLINNYSFDDWEVKPGSMGKPLPGYEVELLHLDRDEPVDQGETGEIALLQSSTPLESEGYLGLPEATEEKFGGEWLRSDDLARVDEDGYYWYEGRSDDVIISAGYRIGPTEVEDSLMKHEAVAEAAVVGLPDPERSEIVAAFILPKEGFVPSDELAEEIQQSVRERLSKHEYPRHVEFVEAFPKTAAGKVKRYKLREEHGTTD